MDRLGGKEGKEFFFQMCFREYSLSFLLCAQILKPQIFQDLFCRERGPGTLHQKSVWTERRGTEDRAGYSKNFTIIIQCGQRCNEGSTSLIGFYDYRRLCHSGNNPVAKGKVHFQGRRKQRQFRNESATALDDPSSEHTVQRGIYRPLINPGA